MNFKNIIIPLLLPSMGLVGSIYFYNPFQKTKSSKKHWGSTKHNQSADLYFLQNKDLLMEVSNYGATITKLYTQDKQNKLADIVLGCKSLEQYENKSPNFGSVTGRVANIIADSKFILDGVTYELPKNCGQDHLHGGLEGFDKKIFKAEVFKTGNNEPGIKFRYISNDGEEGYPGELDCEIQYSLLNNNSLKIDYKATVLGKATLVNLTNHSYFNLKGENSGQDISGHYFYANSKKILEINERIIPTGKFIDTDKDKIFDFHKKFKKIAEGIDDLKNKQISNGLGYDHSFVLKTDDNNQKKRDLVHAASVYEPDSGRCVDVFTTENSVHFYTGNSLDTTIPNKQGSFYFKRAGLCLETQNFPNAVNIKHFPSTILRPGEIYESTTIFQFKVFESLENAQSRNISFESQAE